jgi:ribosomal protein L32E
MTLLPGALAPLDPKGTKVPDFSTVAALNRQLKLTVTGRNRQGIFKLSRVNLLRIQVTVGFSQPVKALQTHPSRGFSPLILKGTKVPDFSTVAALNRQLKLTVKGRNRQGIFKLSRVNLLRIQVTVGFSQPVKALLTHPSGGFSPLELEKNQSQAPTRKLQPII